jgi:excinuclease ABC subunit B
VKGFHLVSNFKPTDWIEEGHRHQVLLGVTGSGKTFTIANVIERLQRPTLVIAHNKALASQLYGEFKELFPENAVEFFVSYYDYYQPEAYIPETDTYIEKDALINDDIDRLRHSATRAVLERRDVIVVASVSCIYGIGSPEDYWAMHLIIEEGMHTKRNDILRRLVEMLYVRGEEFKRGSFRVRGDVVEVYPSFSLDKALRIEFFGDYIDSIYEIDPLSGKRIRRLEKVALYPNSHWITPRPRLEKALEAIEAELKERIEYFKKLGKELEAQRIEQRTRFDMEMLREFGYCHGIENYSRHLSGRAPGEPPYTLIDYFPEDKFEEFERRVNQAIYVSATPGDYELQKSEGRVAEQIIRPTGLMDPKMVVKPAKAQVEDLLGEIKKRVERGERVLVTTLTKKMAEDLTEYYSELGIRARYMHSDIDTIDRIVLLRDLRLGKFDVLIGVNLLREGLDLPEVSLVAILDADKEGFLRSERSLIQTAGRAARNVNGEVILYADTITNSIKKAVEETERRRRIQEAYNREHNITPETVKSRIKDVVSSIYEADYYEEPIVVAEEPEDFNEDTIRRLEEEMKKAAKELDFERAARLRDRIIELKKKLLAVS